MPKEKEKQPMTMEEFIVSQLDEEVVLKDGSRLTDPTDGHVLTKQEAIATNILNLAMKGDIKAAQYISSVQARAKINEMNEIKKRKKS